MGVDGPRGGFSPGGIRPLTEESGRQVIRVVPDIPSFNVDSGFSYLAPSDVGVGAMVRIPLGGRNVRGYVVSERGQDADSLKKIRSVSGNASLFGARLLEVLRWASHHYVAPLSVLLGRTAPPNLPRKVEIEDLTRLEALPRGPLAGSAEHAREGRHFRGEYLVSGGPFLGDLTEVADPVLAADRSVLVVVPTAVELSRLAENLSRRLGPRLLAVGPDASAREATEVWSRAAAAPGFLVAGTPRIALWPVAGLSLLVAIDEGRRAMKERQTPTLHVRDLMARRAAVERMAMAFIGRVPTGEIIAAGTNIVRRRGRRRAWPLVEVVDRGGEPPGSGLFSDTVVAALRSSVSAARTVFVFSHRRGYSAAARCRQCGELRLCPNCGARPDPGTNCRRCGAELGNCLECGGSAFVPLGAGVGRATEELRRLLGESALSQRQVMIGTERDLVRIPAVDLAVVVDADGLILGTNYRASEEALRTLVRVASAVRGRSGRRAMVQTMLPTHPVVKALEEGDAITFLQQEIADRAALGLPPAGQLIVLETADEPAEFDSRLKRALANRAAVLGPSAGPRGSRWLIQGTDLASARGELRHLVQVARDAGARVRVDVDPIDL